MAFNFNWSPLIADTLLARDLLTAALNKTPKPPIIVDDIVVTDINLGKTPPDLTLLEVGDLAQDRFRGVFKVTYGGDAYLTLRTRVQANPLNTELKKRRRNQTRVGWCEPACLAADSGLTIPLQITLSDFRLSGFVILVFSRQKGLTLVFRNDPLESLKVSSTFDSIPFVRDYLQKTIEERLRALFMEDLPAILHRLSLRLWGEESRQQDLASSAMTDNTGDSSTEGSFINPLSAPPQEAIGGIAADLDDSFLLATVPPADDYDIHSVFSQKNMQRLNALSESQYTLSLSTPIIQDAVVRAWTGAPGCLSSGTQSPILSRNQHSFSLKGSSVTASSRSVSVNGDHAPSSAGSGDYERPSFSRMTTSSSYLGLSERHRTGNNPQRRRKHRVINLRNRASETPSITVEDSPHTNVSGGKIEALANETSCSADDKPLSLPAKSVQRIHEQGDSSRTPRKSSKQPSRSLQASQAIGEADFAPPAYSQIPETSYADRKAIANQKEAEKQPFGPPSSTLPLLRTLSSDYFSFSGLERDNSSDQLSSAGSSGGVLEQAWLQKIARETALRVRLEKERQLRTRRDLGDVPPAYAV